MADERSLADLTSHELLVQAIQHLSDCVDQQRGPRFLLARAALGSVLAELNRRIDGWGDSDG